MKKRTISRIAFLLAITSLFTLMAACNQKEIEAPRVKLENVYAMETISLPEAIERPEHFLYGGNKVYISTSGYDEEKGYTTYVYSLNPDGSDAKLIFEYSPDGMGDSEEQEEGTYRNGYLNGLYVDHEGFLWAMEESTFADSRDPNNYIYESSTLLTRYDAQGNALNTINLSEISEDEYFYVNSLLFRNDGKIIVSTGNQIYFMDMTTLAVDFVVKDEERWFDSVFLSADNTVHAMRQNYETGSIQLLTVDEAAKDWGTTIDTSITGYNYQGMMPGYGDYDFFYRDDYGVKGYQKATDTTVEILNWIDSDIDTNYMSALISLSDGRFLCSNYSYDTGSASMGLLKEVPASEIKEKVIITYASQYLNYDVRRQIINFNKSQDDYHISVITYDHFSNEENNWQGGIEALNRDIIGGNIPDIIDLYGLNANNYINKGLFTDIYRLIDADPTTSRDNYLENILEACSKNGKLYHFMPSFSIHTVAAKTSLVGTQPGWTIEDLNELLRRYPEAQAFNEMTRENLLQISARMSMTSFIDLETGKCDFNNQGFIDLLEFAASLPAEINWDDMTEEDWNEYWQKYQNQYQDNLTLLVEVYCYNLRSIRNYVETFQEDITFIGFPSADKNGAAIDSYRSYAISEKSLSKQKCWEFLKSLAPDELVIDSPWYYGDLTINKKALNQLIEFEMTPYGDRPMKDSDGVIRPMRESIATRATASSMIADTLPGIDYEEVDGYANYHLTQAEIDQVMALITSVKKLSYQDQNVLTIITEEIGPFFDGKKNAAATAEIIQSRVQLYVDENQ